MKYLSSFESNLRANSGGLCLEDSVSIILYKLTLANSWKTSNISVIKVNEISNRNYSPSNLQIFVVIQTKIETFFFQGNEKYLPPQLGCGRQQIISSILTGIRVRFRIAGMFRARYVVLTLTLWNVHANICTTQTASIDTYTNNIICG